MTLGYRGRVPRTRSNLDTPPIGRVLIPSPLISISAERTGVSLHGKLLSSSSSALASFKSAVLKPSVNRAAFLRGWRILRVAGGAAARQRRRAFTAVFRRVRIFSSALGAEHPTPPGRAISELAALNRQDSTDSSTELRRSCVLRAQPLLAQRPIWIAFTSKIWTPR